MRKELISNIIIVMVIVLASFLIQLKDFIEAQFVYGLQVITPGAIAGNILLVIIIAGILTAIVFPLKYFVFKKAILRKKIDSPSKYNVSKPR